MSFIGQFWSDQVMLSDSFKLSGPLPGCQDVKLSGCQDIRISGYQDVRMLAGGLSSFISLLGQFAMAPQSGVGD